jgi:hypothetical protein
LWIAAGVAVVGITLAACESANTGTGTDSHATPVAETARQQHVTDAPDVRFPDVTDPAARRQFACSFADGYFTEPRVPRHDAASDCR